ncbi:signal recognition particle-docking protein FtsY [Mesorhizobium mediterraneum]|uniref:Signal recognition particle receptor FtsY n=3 Tax=Mesorhizobium TaxID=68287 RepID=A0AB36RBK8_9HYPH|nr:MULTISPECIES: signal recognition particle-docking protein FtsY [Mesorhizobium]RUU36080.1 signal recognition particle-docking protein FtsY [Mesorhizobium sp. M6A.T.Ca.TU.002.02.2.1]PAQ02268.1 signal recognition particle-docking protein FtsY [Mesorhizobium mediterraneum]RWN44252.1 MAG: signal recognition particle-docking protein FtsY [Mesorhizobium sp.]RWO95220.1 MAG: signal recognition particle-docking protein FtsY [Mesorhizobium sp.]WIW54493.1 signal recognition particle-docking protein Fts
MAGFFKKIFSFGKKEVVEERIDESAPLPPIKWDALEALKPASEQAVPEFLKREERQPETEAAPPPPVEAEAPLAPQPAPVEEAAPAPAPTIPPGPDIQPEPAPIEEPEAPAEEPAPEPEIQPVPVEELGPEPEAPAEQAAPEEIPAVPVIPEPAPAPEPQPPEVAPSQPEKRPEPAPVDMPAPPAEIPSTAPKPEAPPAEIPPPIRQPAPVEAKPILAEIAPEPEAVPQPPPEPKPAPGKVTVTKKVEQKAQPQKAPEPAPKRSWFQRMKEGLARSSRELSGNIAGVFTKRKLDEDTLQDLEDVLIRADLGMETALRITDSLAASRYGKDVSETEVRAIMATEVEKVLTHVAMPLELDLSHKPHVILVVGVNGTGKTTTIGKLAAKLTDGGLSVMLAAGDTFRAAAIEQLKIWGERTKSPVIASKLGADAAGLAYDAFEQAKQAGSDVLIIDTAGRLQNKTELMAELEKIVRVLGKLDPEAPHTVLQTVDATTGQNALNQVEIFRNVAGVNGLVMTKLDGTARGGILVAIAAKHKLPVYFIGVGEQVDDLEPFSASEFARAIAGVA